MPFHPTKAADPTKAAAGRWKCNEDNQIQQIVSIPLRRNASLRVLHVLLRRAVPLPYSARAKMPVIESIDGPLSR
jgi:hypothetical protein